jgi:hypothetical protein
MFQVDMPFMAFKNLKGLCFWADERKRTGLDADAGDLTQEDVISFTEEWEEYNELEDAAKDENASSAPHYLRQIVGAAKIPIIYLARNKRDNPDKPLVPANFGTPTEYLIKATIFPRKALRHWQATPAFTEN